MTLLTTAAVREVLDLTPKEYRTWREHGAAKPATGGEGSGNPARFTVMQLVGMAVGARLRRGGRGCTLALVAEIAHRFGAMTEDELLTEFEAGRTHLLPVGRLPLERPRGEPDDKDRDVRATYQHVIKVVAQMQRRRPVAKVGR